MTSETETVQTEEQALVALRDQPPSVLAAVVLDDQVPFPGTVGPVLLDDAVRRDAVLHAKSGHGYFLLVNSATAGVVAHAPAAPGDERAATDPHSVRTLARVGVVAKLLRMFQMPEQRTSALVQMVRRAQPLEILRHDPFPVVRVTYPEEPFTENDTAGATFRQLRLNLQAFFEAHPGSVEELKLAVFGIEAPGALADFVAQHLSRDFDERLGFLTELDVAKRVRRALEVTVRELDLLTVGNRITQEIRHKVEKTQRDFLLREQLKAIRVELGEEGDPIQLAVKELTAKIEAAGLPEHARQRADEELRRLSMVPTESPEHNVVRSYVEWIATLPWSKSTEDVHDLDSARAVLDADHYGLDEVKERMLEFLAVRELNPGAKGTMLCFAGPPGVGKTSLGQSIARALGRKFYRFSVGGMRDEAEIKGHRRTYIGAMPGRILQGLRQVGVSNPVFMLDEIDKMGSDWRGDPSSAMLEVLDPAQNQGFLDHYLDLSFDLSRVMFIATANVKSEIPGPLLDRMEVIDLPGYIPEEKEQIAARYLLPRQREANGLVPRQLQMGRTALRHIVMHYTMEAGVRELERQIGKICRKRATQVVRGKKGPLRVGVENVGDWLGPIKIHDDRVTRQSPPGIALGLAWTAVGGDILFIEAARMPGTGGVKVTGQLGEVMNESAALALSYVRSHASELGIDSERFRQMDLHLHFPAGAVRKDGPSAGVTVTTAIISLLTERSVRTRLAMTGEMTLRGEVLPVGGIREKVIAAHRAGVRTVIVPERNRADVAEIPEVARRGLTFVYAKHYDQVLEACFATTHRRASNNRRGKHG